MISSVPAILVLSIWLTFMFLACFDRYCSISQVYNIATSQQQDGHHISRAAGFLGFMTSEERRSVLTKILLSVSFVKRKSENSIKAFDPESQKNEIENETGISNPKTVLQNEIGENKNKDEINTFEKSTNFEEISIDIEDTEAIKTENVTTTHAASFSDVEEEEIDTSIHCVICLESYAEGESIIKGNLCVHMYHECCIMEWLDKNDVCPFCRKDMYTAEQFKEAAIRTLSEDRIKDLQDDRSSSVLDVPQGNS